MTNIQTKQLSVIKKWIESAIPHLNANISVRLWNNEIIPFSPNSNTTIVLAINSADAIRKLIFKPKLMTVFELYSDGLIDIEGGTPLEALRSWDHIAVLNFAKSMNKLDFAKTLWPFLFKSKKHDIKSNLSYAGKVADKLEHGRNDKEMIHFHYDISNAFYELFLDPEMVYSCGYFQDTDTSLEDAQIAKLDMICKRLRLKEGEELFDVGCGWGGLVCHAAQNYGVKAYGVTLSQEQYDFVQTKIKKLGLEESVTVELRDYRTVTERERFDKISQIEMFEHVGLDNHDQHFKQMHKLLKPGGLYLHQATARKATPKIDDFRKKTAYQEVITRLIFPGGELDYIGLTVSNLERHRFEVHDVESWREHFQLTLEHWLQRLWDNKEPAQKEIGLEKTRLWLLYFSLFAASFERNTISVFQTLASKRKTGPASLPLTREDLYR
jgi:cyclopropane-fatty-acyl-phospholipid synthase